uniref:Retrotransposon gag protein n=1 Tax=Solanum tuberosum TaxID=4113 RepID=M1B3B1_SOLTU
MHQDFCRKLFLTTWLDLTVGASTCSTGRIARRLCENSTPPTAATLRGSITKQSKPLAQDPLTSTMVRGCPVDISPAPISHFLYGPTTGHSWSLNTSEFDYKWDIVRSGAFQRNAEQREAILLWLARYIAADGELEPQVAPTALADDTVLDAFFSGTVEEGLAPTHAKGKRHRSYRTEEEKAQKRQRRQEKVAKRASLLDEELCQQRVSTELRKAGQGFAWGQQWSPGAGPAQGVGSGLDIMKQ